MRYPELSKVSLLSLTLLIFLAGIIEAVHPSPTKAKAAGTKNTDSLSALLTAQATPQAATNPTTFPVIPNLPQGTQVKIDSSVTMTAINQLLQQRFLQKYVGSELLINYKGTEAALQALLAGNTDLVGIGRPLSEAEQSQGLTSLPLARHKIAVIVGADNPFSGSLTDAQFAKIFRGEITNWAEVGGVDRPLRFVDRPSSSETRQAFQSYPVFRSAPFQAGINAQQMTTEDLEPLVKELGNDGLSYAIAEQVNNKPGLRVILMHNTPPSDSRYPFSQPLGYAYKSANPPPAVQALLGYATTAENQQAIEAARVAGATALTGTIVPSGTGNSPASSPASSGSSPSGGVVSGTGASIAAAGTTSNNPGTTAATIPASSTPASSTLGGVGSGTTDVTTTGSPTTIDRGNQERGDESLKWFLLPSLGSMFLLAWLGRKKRTTGKPSTLILTPEPDQSARVYWEIPSEKIQGIRKRGGNNLTLRLTDVTNINPQVTTPKLVHQVDCPSGSTPLMKVPIPESDREYQAELGSVINDGSWVSLAKSAPTYFPGVRPFLGGLGGAGIVTAIGSTVIGASDTQSTSPPLVSPPTKKPELITPEITSEPSLEKTPIEAIAATQTGKTVSPISSLESSSVELPASLAGDLWADAPQNVAESGIEQAAILQPNTKAIVNPAAEDLADSGIDQSEILQPNAKAIVNPVTEDLPIEVTTPIPPVVPTVEDGGSGLNWGVIAGGAAATVANQQRQEFPKDELAMATPSSTINLIGKTQIHLDMCTPEQGYAYWEIAPEDEQSLKSHGGRDLTIRIHDATDIDIDYRSPHATQEYACDELPYRYVTIVIGDRPYADYLAELGYLTATGEWLRVIRSLHTRFSRH